MNRSSRPIDTAAAVGALTLTAGCAAIKNRAVNAVAPDPVDYASPPAGPEALLALRALTRVAFGPRPGDVARVAALGTAAWIEEQLADKMDEAPIVDWRVNGLDIHQVEQEQPDVLSSMDDVQLLAETQQAAILRAVYCRHQLRETLADFWTNHFNIYALKNDGRVLVPSDTERVIRPHGFGKFRDLLFASAHSPAMLAYLDNKQNKKGVANENYARELLELHTLGVHSGYTQRDIQEVARCLTGWTVAGGFNAGTFVYEPQRHDDGAKYIPFLNLHIAPNGGQRDAEQVLVRLSTHPATARFLATKLSIRYLGSAPKPIVDLAVQAFLRSDGDIRATLRPILLDGLTSTYGATPAVKRPLDLVVSALRALNADTDGGKPLQEHLSAMGQPLYQWPMPDGFPERPNAWTGSLLGRWNFALALSANRIDGAKVDLTAPARAMKTSDLNALLETIYGRRRDDPVVTNIRNAIQRHISDANGVDDIQRRVETAALLIAAPEYQWR